jgi:hypothetical protein
MTDNELYMQFLNNVLANKGVWLIQANEGMFGMLEDNNGQEYLPVWGDQGKADVFIDQEWDGYYSEKLPINEWINWLDELASDGVKIAVSPGTDKQTIPMEAQLLKQHLLEAKA